MPCNLAVTITKAAVSQAQLVALLTPEVVQAVVEAYLRQPGVLAPGETAAVQRSGPTITITIQVGGGRRIAMAIADGVVQATTRTSDQRAQELVDALSPLLARAADARFAQQVQAALARLGPVTAQAVTVANEGIPQQAVVLTMRL